MAPPGSLSLLSGSTVPQRLVDVAIETALSAGAEYVDVRFVEERIQHVQTRNAAPGVTTDDSSVGVGVRALFRGAWGFASTSDTTVGGASDAGLRAVEAARAAALLVEVPAALAPCEPTTARWTSDTLVDPFTVPIADKVELLRAVDERALAHTRLDVSTSTLGCHRIDQLFASSEGSRIEQSTTLAGAGGRLLAMGDDDVQVRSYPNSHGGQWSRGGWEIIEEIALLDHVDRAAEQATALLAAEPCPAGTTTIILDSSQLALQLHESAGHPAELDRLLGWESAYAGGSFLTTDLLGNFDYGSSHVSIVADATRPRGLGSFAFDDEGVEAQRWHLVRAGRFVGYLTSRETAAVIGEAASRGCMRASGWNRPPLIRMVNISLEPGDSSLDALIAGTEDGIYMETNRSWSIDDRRLDFQFGCEIAWEIRDGRRGRMLKNPSYSGTTPQFWRSCDGVAGPDEFRLWGVRSCGKGQPGQAMRMSHGASPARFRGVRVGLAAAS